MRERDGQENIYRNELIGGSNWVLTVRTTIGCRLSLLFWDDVGCLPDLSEGEKQNKHFSVPQFSLKKMGLSIFKRKRNLKKPRT